MKNFITELYYGNIDPQSRGFKKDSYLQKQMKILTGRYSPTRNICHLLLKLNRSR